MNTTPAYAPALVGFVNLNDGNQIGWLPLGPGDIYAPRYYDANWQPRYLTSANIVPGKFINLASRGGVNSKCFDTPTVIRVAPVGSWRLLISASRGSSLAIDHCPPVENVASLVNGFLIHVVVSHRHLHVTVA